MSSLSRERRRAEEAAASNQTLTNSLRQMQSELGAMSEKLHTLTTAPPVPPPAPVRVSEALPATRSTPRKAAVRSAAADPRWSQMQTRLADQQKQIANTRDEVDQTRKDVDQARQDLTGKLSSTRDELNGSIARNHDELATLQKRGERKYYEFQLPKSKEFQHVGPLSISVRKVDFKRKYYDLQVMVDDRQIEKKHVNLYEPLMLTLADRRQPIELVVNGIDKSEVKGYVSEPKYKESDLANGAPPPPDTQGLQRR
jgi:uncharacterized coiled-coil protein SlyX